MCLTLCLGFGSEKGSVYLVGMLRETQGVVVYGGFILVGGVLLNGGGGFTEFHNRASKPVSKVPKGKKAAALAMACNGISQKGCGCAAIGDLQVSGFLHFMNIDATAVVQGPKLQQTNRGNNCRPRNGVQSIGFAVCSVLSEVACTCFLVPMVRMAAIPVHLHAFFGILVPWRACVASPCPWQSNAATRTAGTGIRYAQGAQAKFWPNLLRRGVVGRRCWTPGPPPPPVGCPVVKRSSAVIMAATGSAPHSQWISAHTHALQPPPPPAPHTIVNKQTSTTQKSECESPRQLAISWPSVGPPPTDTHIRSSKRKHK